MEAEIAKKKKKKNFSNSSDSFQQNCILQTSLQAHFMVTCLTFGLCNSNPAVCRANGREFYAWACDLYMCVVLLYKHIQSHYMFLYCMFVDRSVNLKTVDCRKLTKIGQSEYIHREHEVLKQIKTLGEHSLHMLGNPCWTKNKILIKSVL